MADDEFPVVLLANHRAGDEDCPDCWDDYPKRCECGGLIHAEFGDYTSHDSYYLERECDLCGDHYEEVGE